MNSVNLKEIESLSASKAFNEEKIVSILDEVKELHIEFELNQDL